METKVETFMGGDPGWIRTSDLQLRSYVLWPSRRFVRLRALRILPRK
jgi:hypothetical protein